MTYEILSIVLTVVSLAITLITLKLKGKLNKETVYQELVESIYVLMEFIESSKDLTGAEKKAWVLAQIKELDIYKESGKYFNKVLDGVIEDILESFIGISKDLQSKKD